MDFQGTVDISTINGNLARKIFMKQLDLLIGEKGKKNHMYKCTTPPPLPSSIPEALLFQKDNNISVRTKTQTQTTTSTFENKYLVWSRKNGRLHKSQGEGYPGEQKEKTHIGS